MCNLTPRPGEGQGGPWHSTRGQGWGQQAPREKGLGGEGVGVSRGGRGPYSLFTFFLTSVDDSPPLRSFLAAQGRGPCSTGQARGESSWPPGGERGALGGAPGLRHNPVFGSPGGEFPPLHPPGPAPPPPSPRSQGPPPGVPEDNWALPPGWGGRGSEEAGQPSAPTLGIGGEGGDPRPKEPVPPCSGLEGGAHLGTPTVFRGSGWSPPGHSCLPSDQDIVLWGGHWGGAWRGGTKVLVL